MTLLGWAITFLLVSIVAGLFGFTGIAAGAAAMARVVFGIFLLVFFVLLVLVFVGVGAVTGPH